MINQKNLINKLHIELIYVYTINIKKIDEGRVNYSGAKISSSMRKKFKALADQKRLEIMYELCQRGQTCVCDLTEIFEMTQSKLSYHLKILLDAGLIVKETKGTWSYYDLNDAEVNNLLSEELCCIFRKTGKVAAVKILIY